MSIGKRIREARRKKDLTQEELAEKIELTATSVSNLERGAFSPSSHTLEKLLEVLGVTREWLLTGLDRGSEKPGDDVGKWLKGIRVNRISELILRLLRQSEHFSPVMERWEEDVGGLKTRERYQLAIAQTLNQRLEKGMPQELKAVFRKAQREDSDMVASVAKKWGISVED